MKVLLTNGSPHAKGCTYTALCEVAEALNKEGIETQIFSGRYQTNLRLFRLRRLYENRPLCDF